MVTFRFNERRATQAAAYFLERNHHILNCTKLIKLLYLADRMAILRWHEPITGDTYLSLPYGPVLSTILDNISNGHRDGFRDYWSAHISKAGCDSYSVALTEAVEFDELSKREIELLDYLDTRFKEYDQWEMIDYCHTYCEEWEAPDGSNHVITIEDILKAEIADPEEIQNILDEMQVKSSIMHLNCVGL